jgi:DeoR/GlpR family transcriptional regulator of sugar metabolism
MIREGLQVEQKKQIANEALKYISNNDYVILGSGSNIYSSQIIKGFTKLTVLTPSLKLPWSFVEPRFISIVGGDIRNSSVSAVESIWSRY